MHGERMRASYERGLFCCTGPVLLPCVRASSSVTTATLPYDGVVLYCKLALL